MASKGSKGNPGEERFVATGKNVKVIVPAKKKNTSKTQNREAR